MRRKNDKVEIDETRCRKRRRKINDVESGEKRLFRYFQRLSFFPSLSTSSSFFRFPTSLSHRFRRRCYCRFRHRRFFPSLSKTFFFVVFEVGVFFADFASSFSVFIEVVTFDIPNSGYFVVPHLCAQGCPTPAPVSCPKLQTSAPIFQFLTQIFQLLPRRFSNLPQFLPRSVMSALMRSCQDLPHFAD